MGWSSAIGWSYASKLDPAPTMATYYNDTGSKKIIKEFYMYLGTGNASYTAGDTLTGDGSTIEFYVSINGVESSHVYVNNAIGREGSAEGGYYPPVANTKKYTVQFTNGVEVAAGATVSVIGAYNATISYPNQVLVVRKGDDYVGGSVVSGSTYTISYDANGGSGAPTSQTKASGQNLIITSSTPKTAKSYTVTYDMNGGTLSQTSKQVLCTFKGWNTSRDGSGTAYNPGDTYSVDASITLYAQWSDNKVGTIGQPERPNCIFVDWYTAKYNGTIVDENTIISGNIIIYAIWDYMIIYDANGGDANTVPNTQIKKHNTDIWLSSGYPENGGKEFKGWATSSNSSVVAYQPNRKYEADAPLVLYAIWESTTYTVTFDLRGGNYTGAILLVQEVEHGGNAQVPSPNPTKASKQFRGWYGNYNNVTSDRTIIALWDTCPVWIYTENGWIRLHN